ncbi:MAG: hypothetical protein RBT49_01145 [Bacteroidales bacterium]|jgi:hypothetical protein|nr:hypothetical protein [Bacteroidales bacterium]
MYIREIKVNPSGLTVEPELHIEIKFEYINEFPVAIKLNGYLFSERDRISILQENDFGFDRNETIRTITDNRKSNITRIDIRSFVAPLSKIALKKLEERRLKNEKKEIVLDFRLIIEYMKPQFEHTELKIDKNIFYIPTLQNLSILNIFTKNFKETIIISAADWLKEYYPVFGFNKYRIYELPLPRIESSKGNVDISNRINLAIESLKDVETAYNNGEWDKLIKESRPIWELIRNKDEIKILIENKDYNDETKEALNNLLSSLFNFSSKFIHKVSHKGELMQKNYISKEEAELIHLTSLGILNLFSKITY